jgi:hypothetical protein
MIQVYKEHEDDMLRYCGPALSHEREGSNTLLCTDTGTRMGSGKSHLKFYCLQPVGRLACPASALFDWLVGFPDIRTANAEGCWQSLDGRQAAASMACELTASMSNFTKEKSFRAGKRRPRRHSGLTRLGSHHDKSITVTPIAGPAPGVSRSQHTYLPCSCS